MCPIFLRAGDVQYTKVAVRRVIFIGFSIKALFFFANLDGCSELIGDSDSCVIASVPFNLVDSLRFREAEKSLPSSCNLSWHSLVAKENVNGHRLQLGEEIHGDQRLLSCLNAQKFVAECRCRG